MHCGDAVRVLELLALEVRSRVMCNLSLCMHSDVPDFVLGNKDLILMRFVAP